MVIRRAPDPVAVATLERVTRQVYHWSRCENDECPCGWRLWRELRARADAVAAERTRALELRKASRAKAVA